MTTAVQKKTNVDEAFALAPAHVKRIMGSPQVADRFLVVALNQFRKVPALAACSPASIVDALVRMARLGLDPSIPNDVWLVPYKNEASLIVGYGGLRKLVLRHPDVVDVFAQVVCANDVYRPAETQVSLPTHRLPEGFQPRGRAIGYYAAALLKSGIWRVVSMSVAEVEGHRDRYSQAAKSTFWARNMPDKEGLTNFDKMACKTVLRQLCSPRYLSLDQDVAEALETEEAIYRTAPAEVSRPVPIPAMSTPIEVLASELSGDQEDARAAQQAAREGKPRQARKDTPAPPVNEETGEIEEDDVPDPNQVGMFAQDEQEARWAADRELDDK